MNHTLVIAIKRYWADRGYKVTAEVRTLPHKDKYGNHYTRRVICSDVINGLPRDYHGPLGVRVQ